MRYLSSEKKRQRRMKERFRFVDEKNVGISGHDLCHDADKCLSPITCCNYVGRISMKSNRFRGKTSLDLH